MSQPTKHQIQQLSQTLSGIVGSSHVSSQLTDRIAYARDQWPRSLIRQRQGKLEQLPELIVWPASTEEVSKVVKACNQANMPIVPTGAGSAVTGSATIKRYGIILDLKRLDKIRWIKPTFGMVEIESGYLGIHLEEALNRYSCTLGHFPSSIICSTLGGWIAARSAGQTSSYYGKIEDVVIDLEVVFSDGSCRWIQGAFDLLQLIIGSEGMFGIITAAKLRIYQNPKARSFRGILLPKLEDGLDLLRSLMQDAPYPPALLRLYDPFDTMISSHKKAKRLRKTPPAQPAPKPSLLPVIYQKPTGTWKRMQGRIKNRFSDSMQEVLHQTLRTTLQHARQTNPWLQRFTPNSSLLILGYEGQSPEEAEELMQMALRLCEKKNAKDLGPAPGWHWFHNRYQVSFKQSMVFLSGAFSDTMEVACPWSKLSELYHHVKQALQKEALVMAHFSHAYPEGCSIYFSFASYANQDEEIEKYDRIWRSGLQAAHEVGATISHHHGIGIGKAHAMPKELGAGGIELFQALHKAIAPKQLFNPGNLLLD